MEHPMDRNKLSSRQSQRLARKLELEPDVATLEPQKITANLLRGLIELSKENQRHVPRDTLFANPKRFLKQHCSAHVKFIVGSGSLRVIAEISKEYSSFLITSRTNIIEKTIALGFKGLAFTVWEKDAAGDMLAVLNSFSSEEKDLVLFVDKGSLTHENVEALDVLVVKLLRDLTLKGKMLVVIILDAGHSQARLEVL
jgi:hypothetical protein